jgi:hypothetical protein
MSEKIQWSKFDSALASQVQNLIDCYHGEVKINVFVSVDKSLSEREAKELQELGVYTADTSGKLIFTATCTLEQLLKLADLAYVEYIKASRKMRPV